MAERTFGWIQNPSNTRTLQKVVALFDPAHPATQHLLRGRIPILKENGLLHDEEAWAAYTDALAGGEPLPYAILKGKGAGKGGRAHALCSGLAQAVIDAQKSVELTVDGEPQLMKKPYTDDWTADGFLRWAISIGFVAYDDAADSCSITPLGTEFIYAADDDAFNEALGRAFIKYPPVCRVLALLQSGEQLTKFEIGRKLGFTTEAGFTSLPQNVYAQSWVDDPGMRRELHSNYEGSSDKYARMICMWLKAIGWVSSSKKTVTETVGGKPYTVGLQGYTITAKGLKALKMALGRSSVGQSHKIVPFQMLATKGSDINYRRHRRACILKHIERHPRTVEQIQQHLRSKGFDELTETILDDLAGLANTGLNVVNARGRVEVRDTIDGLRLPTDMPIGGKSAASVVKDRLLPLMTAIDHRFLALIDLAFDGTMNREFEILTIDLFTNELHFGGKHLGGSRRPDGAVFAANAGLIIDNKAYSSGYSIPRSHIDEMVRYIQENADRDPEVNPNRWWEVFPDSIASFAFAYISSCFTGQTATKLEEIRNRTGVAGAAIDSENLLCLAESLKRGTLSVADFFGLMDCTEIKHVVPPQNH